jgi:HSP20 family molecular chaperone IbpA
LDNSIGNYTNFDSNGDYQIILGYETIEGGLIMSKNSKFLLILGISFLAVFLGSLTAFMLVFGQALKHTQVYVADSAFTNSRMQNLSVPDDKFFDNIDKQLDGIMKEAQNFNHNFTLGYNSMLNAPATIKTEDNPDQYKVIINLKSFGNDENNVKIDIKDNNLTVSAKYEDKKDNKVVNSSSFYQTLSLINKVDPTKVKREKIGDNLVITIPKQLESNKDKV